MECYSHAGTAAVALCKQCAKGLCRSCIVDSGVGLVCSPACAKEVREADEVVQRSKQVYGIGRTTKSISTGVIMFVASGAVFFGLGVWNSLGERSIDWMGIIMGLLFMGLGVFTFLRTRSMGLRV